VFPLNLYAHVRFFDAQFAHETAGAARTRLSPRPLFEEARTKLQNPGEVPSREYGLLFDRFIGKQGGVCGRSPLSSFRGARSASYDAHLRI
jgi:hypothetical protein